MPPLSEEFTRYVAIGVFSGIFTMIILYNVISRWLVAPEVFEESLKNQFYNNPVIWWFDSCENKTGLGLLDIGEYCVSTIC